MSSQPNDSSGPSPAASPTPVRGARRFVTLALTLVGTTASLAFGVVVLELPMGPPLVILGLGGMTLGLAAITLWRVVAPLMDAEEAVADAPQLPVRIRDLLKEKYAVLKAIKEIEMDHQMGKLTDVDWRELTQRYRARALRIIGELEAGDNYRSLIEQELKHRLAAAAAAAPEAPAPGNDEIRGPDSGAGKA